MFAITAQIETLVDGWSGSVQVPTFYLHENVQGIVTEEDARRVATGLLSTVAYAASQTAIGESAVKRFHVTAVKVTDTREASCGMHNCAAPIYFTQAPGEATGVGRWAHLDPALNYSATSGRGHVARL